GGGGGDQWAAGCRGAHAREFPRAPRLHRRPPESGSGREIPGPGRRLLCMAKCHRGLPPDRRRRLRGVPQAPARGSRCRGARRYPLRQSRAGRGTARAFLLCGVEAGDRGRRAAHGGLHPQEHAKGRMTWRPSVTVAAVIERGGRFLFVEERIDERLVLNQPAGHLDPDESLAAACRREVLEETAHPFEPRALVGIYRWHYAKRDVT